MATEVLNEQEEAAATSAPAVELKILTDSTTGYAAIQNNIPVIRTLSVKNNSEETLCSLDILVFCTPAFAQCARFHFEQLASGETRTITPVDLQPDHAYLIKLDEAEKASIRIKAVTAGATLAEINHTIEVLAYDQWAGTRCLPELLAAFSMPNSVVVDRLLGKASTLLRKSGAELSLDGYQSKNRERVWKQVSAIYSALLAEGLHYSNPPASFVADGQKIRTPERIFDGRVATCLDLAMLFASCFEQAGLNPVVLFKEGHAWIGVWLIETNFPTSVVDEVMVVRKRVKSGEFLTLETTGIASDTRPSLRWACTTGDAYLEEDEKFHYAVDIRRARELQIRALPSRSTAQEPNVVIADEAPPSVEDMPSLPPLDPELLPPTELFAQNTPEDRLAKWKSKLLDLTLRNRLLNFKPSKSNLKVISHDPGALEDKLSESKDFRIKAAPQVMDGGDPRSSAIFKGRTGQIPLLAFAEDALAKNEIVVDVPEDKLDERLTEIYRAAETGKEEGGVNTLFLVFGLLQWQEDKNSEVSHLAPILLIPVTITRQSVRTGFRLTRHDDDALINPTLVQKLANDFQLKLPSFDVLPTDDKGLDVEKIFQTFRLNITEMPGWEVKEHVHLGIFSFTKYLMWKDLQDRQKQLQENTVVAHLINNPGTAFSDSDLEFAADTLDDRFSPQLLYTPMLSDSSQLRAICVVDSGNNLVLEGPPGTGKSQTITNLICHLLATGKTVLFVSEKMAALEVVHRRLNSIGLGPFCLELHSAKAKKSEILSQLGKALDAGNARTVKDWELEAEKLAALRSELNALVRSLHKTHPNDLTIYDAMGTCIKYAHWKAALLDWTDPNQHSRKELDNLRTLCRQMAALASQLRDLKVHPLSAIKRTAWSPSWQQELLDAAASLSVAATTAQELVAPFLHLLGRPESGSSWSELASLDHLSDILLKSTHVPIGVARAATDELARNRLKMLRHHGLQREAAWKTFDESYREEVVNLNGQELEIQWGEANSTWWPKSWLAKRSCLKRFGHYRTDSKSPSESEVNLLIRTLRKLNEEDKAISAMGAEATVLLQEEFNGHKTNWNAVDAHEKWAKEYSDALAQLAAGDIAVHGALLSKLLPYVTDNRAMLRADGVLGGDLVRYRDAYRQLVSETHRVAELSGVKDSFIEEPQATGAIQRLLARLQGWQHAAHQIQPWCLWQNNREKVINVGLPGIVRSLEAGEVALADIADFFEYTYQSWWARKAIDQEPVLCAFSSADHERKIVEFKESDERFQKLTQQYVVAKLSGQIPSSTTLAPGADSELGKLRRELTKQRNHMPIRQLVKSLPSLLPKLKPCLLMSPLSAAQYLEAGHQPFDVVIFDEASQIPVWDAVGAIARGKQLVCVGDPKQLPPTNFFNRVDDDDRSIGEDEVQDLESILDECLSIGLPKLGLDWHYRSRHESLITFSNATYYDNRLITFPSPVTEDKAVRFERVHGVYDRGGSRTNRAEAEAIVAAIEKHYLSPAGTKQSLGVVTFNQAQQSLIANLLDARRRLSTKLDQAIAEATFEPIFVKNLENVQGDERDIIYFSITYGPDAAGKLALNFGPLNLEGGHRRLNVAVSRARQGVVIFSTLMPEQIDLSRVRAAGVRDLKNYLDFAIRGSRALIEQINPTGLEPDSPFEKQVINYLREKGWTVHPQVGVSGYRIDIGVVDPRAPGRYLLGIECDGATYHSAATARDRDRLRHLILEGLGWELHRIWSTDWWRNQSEPMQKILSRLEHLLTAGLSNEDTSGEVSTESEYTTEPEDVETVAYAKMVQPDTTPESEQKLPAYLCAEIAGGHPDHFYAPASRITLAEQLAHAINTEGPIADAVLFRKVARAWGLARTGKRIEEQLRSLLPSKVVRTFEVEGDTIFYWPESSPPAQWQECRIAGESDDSKRQLSEICSEELVNLASFILSEHGVTSVSELARTICRLQRIARTTADAETRIVRALQVGRIKEFVQLVDGTVSLSKRF
jgi:very-short-patch-repair endonuclease